ncbi:MAG: glutamate-1-semialdehyde 2,1-aminomutase, partial [Acidobacteria bacterium]|nr:glutamate-1-semialdehyde 2,1-aminomutase [Acidobacteriota bacterium]NIM60200.1 glutamate-1-semialdehyde 2,1-aminomutase [Acidobacteriota bacterium]NIO57869.1 glutamate-1-semialdehyde 2,1-aminomutase [Acidobacteriota bacterium]NIQ28878.1 glutamate-1-semialdehyde 2,1-aminomutase [Acidobacteriota bacterium]NIQ83336.1 glutamate-1-semialdehyde 2,1-aminomutase [Acidobacteriota bacterium]
MVDEFERARRVIPGGVNSPVRAFKGVGGTPIFFEHGAGSRVTDTSGKSYIDYVGSWGPLIAGHGHPAVVKGIQEQAANGTSFGAPCRIETDLAERVCERVPGCERVRFVSSGTEATMSAIRLARGATGRDELIKIEGCYHGHVDSLLVQAGSGVLTLGLPGSPGIPAPLAELTHVVPFNDADAVERVLKDRGDRVAALIVEPIAGNMGVIPPAPGYLERLRELTAEHGVTLIFDEVMTGFRVHRGGAQGRFGIEPDLSCFGKVIGGGLPVGAYGGRADVMEQIAPGGPVYQAGTLSGNPLAMRAGFETLGLLDDDAYRELERLSARLQDGLRQAAESAGIEATSNRVGSMMTTFFRGGEITNYADATASDTDRYARFFHGMLERGVYLAPSQFEAAFVSLAHSDDDI